MATSPTRVPISEAAETLDVSTRTIRRWIAAGYITGYRVGPRLIRVDMSEVEALAQPIPTSRLS